MPVRPNENTQLVTRDCNGKNVTLPAYKWAEADDLVKRSLAWNAQVPELCKTLATELAEKLPDKTIEIVTKPYHKLEDNIGNEQVKPRGYLSLEICIIKISGDEEKYYFGRFADTTEFLTTAIQDLTVKYGIKSDTSTEDRGSSTSDTKSNGGGPRKTRPQRDPKEVR